MAKTPEEINQYIGDWAKTPIGKIMIAEDYLNESIYSVTQIRWVLRPNGQELGAKIMNIGRSYRFESAHFLPFVPDGHKCRNMHGHNYKIEVVVEGRVDNRGFVMDFSELDDIVNPIIKKLDHRIINNIIDNPTAENIAAWIKNNIKLLISLKISVRVYETDNGWAEA